MKPITIHRFLLPGENLPRYCDACDGYERYGDDDYWFCEEGHRHRAYVTARCGERESSEHRLTTKGEEVTCPQCAWQPLEFSVTKVVVVLHRGSTDHVSIETSLPIPFNGCQGEKLSLKFEATPGTAVAYIQQHFPGVLIEVIDAKDGKISYPG